MIFYIKKKDLYVSLYFIYYNVAITLLVDKKDCGLPLHATPVGTSLCSLKLANGM